MNIIYVIIISIICGFIGYYMGVVRMFVRIKMNAEKKALDDGMNKQSAITYGQEKVDFYSTKYKFKNLKIK